MSFPRLHKRIFTADGLGPTLNRDAMPPEDKIPDQEGQSGKFLTTDGSDLAWQTVNALPSQSSSTANKFLKSTGTAGSEEWATVDLSTKQDVIPDLDTIRTGAALGATAQQPATTLAGYGISDAKIDSGVITLGSDTITPLTTHQDISGKADKATTLAGYGITDAKIDSGVITLGSNTITPLTTHQDISGKQDVISDLSTIRSGAALGATAQQPATTLAGYGITDAKIASGVITLGSNTITPLTTHQDISGKADKATTLAGYGITDAKIDSGTITLGSKTITPVQSVSLSSGTSNGTLKLTVDGASSDNISVTGLGAMAYKASLVASDIPSLDASKITSGVLSVDRIPATALNKVVVVATEAAKLELTIADVQTGDTVKVTATKKMYMVKDDTKLGTEAAFEEYVASADWSAITNKPSTYPPSSHTHDYEPTSTAVRHTASTAVGSTTQPVYIAANGTATATSYSLAKSVPSDAKFTDTVTTASTTGSGNAVTDITASNGALTVTKGTTFLTSHQDISGKQDKSTAVTHTASTAAGGTTRPVYVNSSGVATAISYTIAKSVPSNAVFTDTNYYPSSFSWSNGTSSGPTGSLTGTGVSVSFGAIPSATASVSGVVTTGAQTFAGNKTFNGTVQSPTFYVGSSSNYINYNSSTGCLELVS